METYRVLRWVTVFSFAAALALAQSVTIPARFMRALLPNDGEVLSYVIRPDVWTDNRLPYERNETIELALGVGLRSKSEDREHQDALTPSFAMGDGFVEIYCGWRAHVQVPLHPDHFDGTLKARLYLGMAGGGMWCSARVMDVAWRTSKLVAVADQFLPRRVVESIDFRAEAELQGLIDARIPQLMTTIQSLIESAIPKEALSRSTCSVKADGLVIEVSATEPVSVVVPLGLIRMVPELVSGDSEFGGHGPAVALDLAVKFDKHSVWIEGGMTATETQEKSAKKRTVGTIAIRRTIWVAPNGRLIETVDAPVAFKDSFTMSGHAPVKRKSEFGEWKVSGDTKGQDVGSFTQAILEGSHQVKIRLAAH